MTRVKVCGVTEIDHALAAAEAGADMLGLVFYPPSKRYVSPEKAKEIASAVGQCHPRPITVGVFVNVPAPEVSFIADFCGLDRVQLSGYEDWQYCQLIEKPLIKAVHVAGQSADEILADLALGHRMLGRDRFICLLDTEVKGSYGGTGESFDWTLAEMVSSSSTVLLAGGLDADNVAQAVREARPWGVDVSSGVETGDKKDIAKIKAFIEAVRGADETSR